MSKSTFVILMEANVLSCTKENEPNVNFLLVNDFYKFELVCMEWITEY
jgi:hypothetical protein